MVASWNSVDDVALSRKMCLSLTPEMFKIKIMLFFLTKKVQMRQGTHTFVHLIKAIFIIF